MRERRQVARTLPDFLGLAGEDGWVMGSHPVSRNRQPDGVAFHHMPFKCSEIASIKAR